MLAEDKKELIRAVARNAGGGSKYDSESDDDDEIGLDVVANKGAASIFLLSGPPGENCVLILPLFELIDDTHLKIPCYILLSPISQVVVSFTFIIQTLMYIINLILYLSPVKYR